MVTGNPRREMRCDSLVSLERLQLRLGNLLAGGDEEEKEKILGTGMKEV